MATVLSSEESDSLQPKGEHSGLSIKGIRVVKALCAKSTETSDGFQLKQKKKMKVWNES